MESVDDRTTMQMLLCGVAFQSTLWDPYSGDCVREYKQPEGALLIDEDGEIEEEKIFMGEVDTRSKSAFSIIPGNDTIPDIKDQPWMLDRSFYALDQVEKVFTHLRGKLNPSDADHQRTEYEKIAHRLGNPVFGGNTALREKAKDVLNTDVLVKAMWIKPNYQYEQGVLVVVIGNELAKIDIWPNDFGQNVYPFVKFTEREDGFHFWPQATVERLIPIQKAYNRLRQHKMKSAMTMASPKWLLPKGSQVLEDAITDEVSEIIEYNPAVTEPHPAQMAPLPNYVTELARELIVDFRDAGGQRESTVTPPPNVTAGVAMQVAAEQGDEIIGPIIKRFGRSKELVAQQQLILMNEEYIEPRKFKVLGGDNQIAVYSMSNADFRNHTDVHIEIESMYPDFRGAKRQALLDLWDRRVIADPKQFLKAFRFGNYDYLIDEADKIEDMIHFDIAMMKKGKIPEMYPGQNHMAYFQALSKFVQSPEFLRLIPERKQMFIQVMQMHLQQLMGQMPGGGAVMPQTNQAAVGTPSGSQVTVGLEGQT
jgi:hypothetical protein